MSAARVTAGHVVAGRDGAPLPAGTAARVAGLPGVRAATGTVPTEVFLLDHGLTGWDAPWQAAGVDIAGARGTLDLGMRRGDLRDVRGDAVAISGSSPARATSASATRSARGWPTPRR